MARWTDWRLIADKENWYDEVLNYDGPACYELGLGVPFWGDPTPVYVGETCNERQRLSHHASNRSHLGGIIQAHLDDGWNLYYRARAASSKEHAKQMQDNLLRKYEYDWNID